MVEETLPSNFVYGAKYERKQIKMVYSRQRICELSKKI